MLRCRTFVCPSPAIRFKVRATRTVFSSKSIANTLSRKLISSGVRSEAVKSSPGSNPFDMRISFHTLKILWTVNPELPQAVSIMVSFSVGFIIFTHISITYRGVKYWPFSPFCALLIKYSKASSTTSRLLLKSLMSCRVETQTARCEGESRILLSSAKPLNFLLQLKISISAVAKFQVSGWIIGTNQFIIEFCKNKLKYFLE